MTIEAFGIDIGGSGIKGAPVDLDRGELAHDRLRIPTPQPSIPDAVADTVAELLDAFQVAEGLPVGVTFPAVIQHGVAKTASNVDKAWIDTDVDALLTERTGHDVFVVNDADAAGIAEITYGAGKGVPGMVLVTTLGTGVGTALFQDGHLVPNTELGHIPLHGAAAEKYMADSARERDDLGWGEWAERLQEYYSLLEFLLSPDLFIVGGGVSKKHEKFLPKLDLRTPIVPAQLRNEAGIIGAAALAHRNGEQAASASRKESTAAEKAARSAEDEARTSGVKTSSKGSGTGKDSGTRGATKGGKTSKGSAKRK
ncbi:ROK family protein [Brachybacterium sp. EF45031]|uniref:polyphosphate--glucose phosphotransferase n=1 Tax=Brachybacterium sillae TaxID=2810536 RepID=UPI0032E7FA7E|nr:ROK family protein [Brachybacterium sillae]